MQKSIPIPGGAQGGLRREFHRLGFLVLKKGSGSRVWDVDGREYIDFHLAFGAVILGHSDPDIAKVIYEQSTKLVLNGAGTTEEEIEYATLISRLIPSAENVVFTNSGSEAVMLGLRVARSYTNRKIIVKFDGNYHGWHDYGMINTKNPADNGKIPESKGIPKEILDTVEVLPYNDVDSFKEFMYERGEEVAAVILEPVAHSMGVVPAEYKFLKTLRELTKQYGALLIFDEIITGVRYDIHGYQHSIGIIPDLTTLGKGIANGLPVAALVGKKEYMDVLLEGTVSSGTYSGNPLVTAGGLKALEKSVEIRVDKHLNKHTEDLVKTLNEIFNGIAVISKGNGVFSIHFGLEEPPKNLKDSLKADRETYMKMVEYLRKNNILVAPNYLKRFHLSYSHTYYDYTVLVDTLEKFVKSLNKK